MKETYCPKNCEHLQYCAGNEDKTVGKCFSDYPAEKINVLQRDVSVNLYLRRPDCPKRECVG